MPNTPTIDATERELRAAEAEYKTLLDRKEYHLQGGPLRALRGKNGFRPMIDYDAISQIDEELLVVKERVALLCGMLERSKKAAQRATGSQEKGDRDIVRTYAAGFIKGTPNIPRNELVETIQTNLPEGRAYAGETILDWIRDLFPDYTPLRPGRKPKK